MTPHAKPATVAAGEMSVLAVVECAVAILIYLAVSVHLGTFMPYTLAIAFAPVLLLRTQRSTDMALQQYRRVHETLGNLPDSSWQVFLFAPSMAICGIAIRIGMTTWCAIRHPIEAIKAAPANWHRQALCTDMTIPPEIVPGEADYYDDLPTFRESIELARSVKDIGTAFAFVTVLVPILLIGYVPSLLLRVSFKASSFAYVPFIWMAHSSLNSKQPLPFRLARVSTSELEKFRRVVSLFIVTCLLLKLLIASGVLSLDEVSARLQSTVMAHLLAQASHWPSWQVMLLIEAGLTYFLFFFADAASSRITAGRPWPTPVVQYTFEGVTLTRAVMASVAVVLVLVAALAQIGQLIVNLLPGL